MIDATCPQGDVHVYRLEKRTDGDHYVCVKCGHDIHSVGSVQWNRFCNWTGPVRWALVILLSLCTLRADAEEVERVLPAGTEVRVADDPETDRDEREVLTLSENQFLLTRDTIDWANAQANTSRRLQEQLEECRTVSAKPDGSRWDKWRWAGAGAAVATAFLLGLSVGQKL